MQMKLINRGGNVVWPKVLTSSKKQIFAQMRWLLPSIWDPGMLGASRAQPSGLLGLVRGVNGRKGCAGWAALSPVAFRPELHSCCDPLHCSWHAFYFCNFLKWVNITLF